jgi:multidrug resistance efflux pump
MKKREYKVKSNKDFLIFGFVFFFLCIWAIKDAWYPSDKVLKKHPREITYSFPVGGQISKVHVAAGDFVPEDGLLIELSTADVDRELAAKKRAYATEKKSSLILQKAIANATENGATQASIEEMRLRKIATDELMQQLQEEVNELRSDRDHFQLTAEKKGHVEALFFGERIQVDAGETILKMIPQDNFYLFNKSLAVISLFASIFFFVFHFFGN